MDKLLSFQREREFEDLSAFIDLFSTKVLGIDPSHDIHPSRVQQEIIVRYGRSKALEGLRQATNDALTYLNDCPPEIVEDLEITLRDRGLLRVSELRRRYSLALKRILKRGKIGTETEYYQIKEIVDLSSEIASAERVRLQELMLAFEDRPNPSFQRTATPPLS